MSKEIAAMILHEWLESLPEDEGETYGLLDAFAAGFENGRETLRNQLTEELKAARDEIDRLRLVALNVYEVWAGSEGIPMPETAAEAYLLHLVKQMRDEAKDGLYNKEVKDDAQI